MEWNQRIRSYIETRKDSLRKEFLALLSRMVAEPTVNVAASALAQHPYLKTSGEESRVSRIIREWAQKERIQCDCFSRRPERENLILRIGEGNGRRLFIPGHMDVVPAGEGWSSDPFCLRIDGDMVYGRGAVDNKGPLTAALLALKVIKDCEIPIRGEIQVGALSDEELMSEDGIDYGLIFLLDAGHINADMAIVPDIGYRMRRISVAEKGIAHIEVLCTGKKAHGSRPENGINAIDGMAEFLTRLRRYAFMHEKHHVLGSYTVNTGQVSGGDAPNIVPDRCSAILDFRLVPGMTPENVCAEMESLTEGLEAGFSFRVKSYLSPTEVDPESELVRAIQRVTKEVAGFSPAIMGMGGGTYAKFLVQHGIEAVGFSTGDENAMHITDEYASISEHMDFIQVIAGVAADLTT